MGLTARALRPFGVEVAFDPHGELDPSLRDELRRLFLEHHLLVMHSDGMTVAETTRICGAVATVLEEPGVAPEAYVSSPSGKSVLPDVEIPWHSDMNFNEMPHLGASLYAEEIDELSSPTWFANAARAAAELPEPLRDRVAPLWSLHELPAIPGAAGAMAAPAGSPEVRSTRHPVLWTHPITGEELLYVSQRQAQQAEVLEDLSDDAARSLLDEVFAHLYQPAHVYEHHWTEGDLVIWDNLAVQHRRGSVGGRRTIRRLALVDGDGAGDQYFKIQAMVRAQVQAAR
ncbi:MAG: taurine dioxygenase [Acidimicrobiales bacterium]|nr:taurine dioxygenase [Acidimicrobiales bacterium]